MHTCPELVGLQDYDYWQRECARPSVGQYQNQPTIGDARDVRTHMNRMHIQMTDASGGMAITAINLHHHRHDWHHHHLRHHQLVHAWQTRSDWARIGGLATDGAAMDSRWFHLSLIHI